MVLERFERRNKILNHDLFIQYLKKTEEAEEGRRFCRHNMAHFLDVARLALILRDREQLAVEEDLIYAAALLHDIGRFVQYENGTPHEKASAFLAPAILKDCGYDDKETDVIVEAVSMHRNVSSLQQRNLNGLLYRADKMSRCCFACGAEKECGRKQDKKNKTLQY